MEPLNISVTELAEKLSISRKHLSNIINEKASITPDVALKLSRAFGTTPELWLNLQKNVDLWDAMHASRDWEQVEPIQAKDIDIAQDTNSRICIAAEAKQAYPDRKAKRLHVLFEAGKWIVKSSRAQKARGLHQSRSDAIIFARSIAMQNDQICLVIHRKNGHIESEKIVHKNGSMEPLSPKSCERIVNKE